MGKGIFVTGTGTDVGKTYVTGLIAMDVERKIEHGGAFGKFEQITFGGKYKYLVFVQIQFELVHRFQSVAVRAL